MCSLYESKFLLGSFGKVIELSMHKINPVGQKHVEVKTPQM